MSARRSLVFSFIGQYADVAVQFAASVAVSRLLAPDEVGVFSVAVSLLALLQVLREFGISRYLVQEPELTEARLRTAYGLMILTSWSLAAVLLAASTPIAAFYERPEMAAIVVVLVVNYLVAPLGQPALALMMRDMQFGRRSAALLSGSLVHAAVAVGLAFEGFSSMSLAIGSVIGTLVQAAVALYLYPQHIRLRPGLSEWRRIAAVGGALSGSAILAQLGSSAPEAVIGRLLTMSAAGLFARAAGLVLAFNRLVLGAIGPVLAARLSEIRRGGASGGGGGMAEPYLHATSCLLVVGWPFFTVLAVLAEPLVVFVYGPAWAGVAPLLQILCLSRIVLLPTMLATEAYLASGAVRLQLKVEAVLQGFGLLLLVAAAFHSIEAVAASRLLVAAAAAPLHLCLVARIVGYSRGELLRAVWRSLVVEAALLAWSFGYLALALGAGWTGAAVAGYLAGAAVVVAAAGALVGHEIGGELARLASSMRRLGRA